MDDDDDDDDFSYKYIPNITQDIIILKNYSLSEIQVKLDAPYFFIC